MPDKTESQPMAGLNGEFDPGDSTSCQRVLANIAKLGLSDVAAFRNALLAVTNRACLAALDDAETISRIRRDSYVHPLGFLKIILVRGGLHERELRLNFWEPRRDRHRPPTGIHNHAWLFRSCIISGRFQKRLYRLVDGDDYLLSTVTPYEHGSGLYQSANVGLTGIRLTAEFQLGPGTVYALEAGALHTFEPGSDRGHTLLLQEPFEASHSRIVTNANDTSSPISAITLPTTETVSDALEQHLASLHAHGGAY